MGEFISGKFVLDYNGTIKWGNLLVENSFDDNVDIKMGGEFFLWKIRVRLQW